MLIGYLYITFSELSNESFVFSLSRCLDVIELSTCSDISISLAIWLTMSCFLLCKHGSQMFLILLWSNLLFLLLLPPFLLLCLGNH